MKMFEGVLLYELMLMILGLAVGIMLMVAFVNGVMKNKTNLKLLYGFIIPLIFIGYPSIQKMQFSKDMISIEKTTKELEKNPTDTAAQKALMEKIQIVSNDRTGSSSEALTHVAEAQLALGQYDSAEVTIKKAIEVQKTPEAVKVQQEIQQKKATQQQYEQKIEKLDDQIDRLYKKPNSKVIKDSIKQVLRVLDKPVHIEDKAMLTIAKGAAVVGDKKTAEMVYDRVAETNPKLEGLKEVKRQIDQVQSPVIANDQQSKPQFTVKAVPKPHWEEPARGKNK